MTPEQFLGWYAFDQVDPIGGARLDWNVASICSTLWNIALLKAKASKIFKPADFLLEWKTADERQDEPKAEKPKPDWQRMRWLAMAWTAYANEGEKRKQRKR